MDSSRPTVVVVDDSSTIRVFFEQTVAALDVDLRVFGSAADSMTFLRSQRPALLFLDIIMPDKDGLTFLQELRKYPHHQSTPVVVISSKDYAQDRMTAKHLGAVEYVAKPMSKKTIHDLIVKYTRRDADSDADVAGAPSHE